MWPGNATSRRLCTLNRHLFTTSNRYELVMSHYWTTIGHSWSPTSINQPTLYRDRTPIGHGEPLLISFNASLATIMPSHHYSFLYIWFAIIYSYKTVIIHDHHCIIIIDPWLTTPNPVLNHDQSSTLAPVLMNINWIDHQYHQYVPLLAITHSQQQPLLNRYSHYETIVKPSEPSVHAPWIHFETLKPSVAQGVWAQVPWAKCPKKCSCWRCEPWDVRVAKEAVPKTVNDGWVNDGSVNHDSHLRQSWFAKVMVNTAGQ